MTNNMITMIWILSGYVIAIYFFQVLGFFIWTVLVIIILANDSTSDAESSTQKSAKPKKKRRDDAPMIEYSDLIVTRFVPKKKRKWEKKIARYSKYKPKR